MAANFSDEIRARLAADTSLDSRDPLVLRPELEHWNPYGSGDMCNPSRITVDTVAGNQDSGTGHERSKAVQAAKS